MTFASSEEGSLGADSRLAGLLYLVLFPAFFAYYLLAALGAIPLFMGAWWGLSTLLCLVVLGFFACKKAITRGPWLIHGSVGILFAGVAGYALYYRFFGHAWQQDQEMFTGSVKLLIAWGGLYCVGFLIEYDQRLQKAAAVSLGGMALAAFLLIDPLDFSFIPTEWAGVQPGVAGYQWFSQAVLFTGILSLGFAKRLPGQIVTLAVMDATLFLTASRADLIAATAVTMGWFVIQIFRRRFLDIIPAAFALGVTAALVSVYPAAYIAIEKAGPAMFDYLTPKSGSKDAANRTRTETIQRYAELGDLSNSPSMQERNKYFWSGWEAIEKSPLAGDYGGQIRDHGKYGAYMHNALGAWRDYGILAFVLFSLLTIAVPIAALWKVLWQGADDPLWMLALYAGGVILVSALAVKSVYWPLPAFGWGLLAANIVREKSRSYGPTSTLRI